MAEPVLILLLFFNTFYYFFFIFEGIAGKWRALLVETSSRLGSSPGEFLRILSLGLFRALARLSVFWLVLLVLMLLVPVSEFFLTRATQSSEPFRDRWLETYENAVSPVLNSPVSAMRLLRPYYNAGIRHSNAFGGTVRVVTLNAIEIAESCPLIDGREIFWEFGAGVGTLTTSIVTFFVVDLTTKPLDLVTPMEHFRLVGLQLLNVADCWCQRARNVWTIFEIFFTPSMSQQVHNFVNLFLSLWLLPFQAAAGIGDLIANFLLGAEIGEAVAEWYWTPERGANLSRPISHAIAIVETSGSILDDMTGILVESFFGIRREEVVTVGGILFSRAAQLLHSLHVSYSAWLRYPIRSVVAITWGKYAADPLGASRARAHFEPAEKRLVVWRQSSLAVSEGMRVETKKIAELLREVPGDNADTVANLTEATGDAIAAFRDSVHETVWLGRRMLHVLYWANLWPVDEHPDERAEAFAIFDAGLADVRATQAASQESRRELLEQILGEDAPLVAVIEESHHFRAAVVEAIVRAAEAARNNWRVTEPTVGEVQYRFSSHYNTTLDAIFFEAEAFVVSVANLVRSWSILNFIPETKSLPRRASQFNHRDPSWRARHGLRPLVVDQFGRKPAKARGGVPGFPPAFGSIEDYLAAVRASYGNDTTCEFRAPHDIAFSANKTGYEWPAPELVTEPVCCLANSIESGGLLLALLVRDFAELIIIPLHIQDGREAALAVFEGPLNLERSLIPLVDAFLRDRIGGACFLSGLLQLLSVPVGPTSCGGEPVGPFVVELVTRPPRIIFGALLNLLDLLLKFIAKLIRGDYCSPTNPCFFSSAEIRGQLYSRIYTFSLGQTYTWIVDLVELIRCQFNPNDPPTGGFWELFGPESFLTVDDAFTCTASFQNDSCPIGSVPSDLNMQQFLCCWPTWFRDVVFWIRAILSGEVFRLLWDRILTIASETFQRVGTCIVVGGRYVLGWLRVLPWFICDAVLGDVPVLNLTCPLLDGDFTSGDLLWYNSRYQLARVTTSDKFSLYYGTFRTIHWSDVMLLEPLQQVGLQCFRPTGDFPLSCMQYQFVPSENQWESTFDFDGVGVGCEARYGDEDAIRCRDPTNNESILCSSIAKRRHPGSPEYHALVNYRNDPRLLASLEVWCSSEKADLVAANNSVDPKLVARCANIASPNCSKEDAKKYVALRSLAEHWLSCMNSVAHASFLDQFLFLATEPGHVDLPEFVYDIRHTIIPPLFMHDYSTMMQLGFRAVTIIPHSFRELMAGRSALAAVKSAAPRDELFIRLATLADNLFEKLAVYYPEVLARLQARWGEQQSLKRQHAKRRAPSVLLDVDRIDAMSKLQKRRGSSSTRRSFWSLLKEGFERRARRGREEFDTDSLNQIHAAISEFKAMILARRKWLDRGCDDPTRGCRPEEEPFPRGSSTQIHEWGTLKVAEKTSRARGHIAEARAFAETRRRKFPGLEQEADLTAKTHRHFGELYLAPTKKASRLLNCTGTEEIGECWESGRQDALCMVTGARFEDGYCEERVAHSSDGSTEPAVGCRTTLGSLSARGLTPNCERFAASAVRGLCCLAPVDGSSQTNITQAECDRIGGRIFTTGNSSLAHCTEEFTPHCFVTANQTCAGPRIGPTCPSGTLEVFGSSRCAPISTVLGACCLQGRCALLQLQDCELAGGTGGTWERTRNCAESSLALECGGCTQSTCRRCDLVQSSGKDMIDIWARAGRANVTLGACCNQESQTCSQTNLFDCPVELFDTSAIRSRHEFAVRAVRILENRTYWIWNGHCDDCGFASKPSPAEVALFRLGPAERVRNWFSGLLREARDRLEAISGPPTPVTVNLTAGDGLGPRFLGALELLVNGVLNLIGVDARLDVSAVAHHLFHIVDPDASSDDARAIWYWARNALICDPVAHPRGDRAPHGLGLRLAFIAAVIIFVVFWSLARRIGILQSLPPILRRIIGVAFFFFVLSFIAYASGLFCLISVQYARIFAGGPGSSLALGSRTAQNFRGVPPRSGARVAGSVANVPIWRMPFRIGTAAIMLSSLWPILHEDLFDDAIEISEFPGCVRGACVHTCPPEAGIWPCGWVPAVQKNCSLEPDCCETAPCIPGENRVRFSPDCYHEPYQMVTLFRVLEYWTTTLFNFGNRTLPANAATDARWAYCGREVGTLYLPHLALFTIAGVIVLLFVVLPLLLLISRVLVALTLLLPPSVAARAETRR